MSRISGIIVFQTKKSNLDNLDQLDQFSYLGNRARYEFIELDMSTGHDMSIPSSRPLTFPGGESKNGYRFRISLVFWATKPRLRF